MSDVQTAEDLQQELLAKTGLTPRDGESAKDFTVRVARRIHTDFTDDQWGDLTEEAQNWTNNNIEANEGLQGRTYQLLMVPESEQADEAQSEEAEKSESENTKEEIGDDEMAAKKEKGAKKANGNGKPKKNVGRKGRTGKFPMDGVVTVLAGENPKRKGSEAASRFAKYKTGKTVSEMITAGVRWTDLNWDSEHGHIKIG